MSGSLQIRHSQESDEGKYECVAENTAGVAYSYGANLYVRGTFAQIVIITFVCIFIARSTVNLTRIFVVVS